MAQLHIALKKYGKGSLSQPAILKEVFQGTWKDAKKAQKEKEKKAKESGNDKHAPSNGELTAVLCKKADDYSANAYTHLMSDSGRNKVYSNFKYVDLAYGDIDWMPRFIRKYFKFPGEMKCNFNKKATLKGRKTPSGNPQKAGQRFPYKWEAHHMIPASAFYTELDAASGKKPVFKPTHYALLLMSDYNVNNGHNMIPLPTNGMDRYQPVHALIQHPSDHSNYTRHVQTEMKKIADDLDDLFNEIKDEPHPKIDVDIAAALSELEDDLWKLLIRLGDVMVGAGLNGRAPQLNAGEGDMVSKKAANGTQYTFGALV